MKKKFIATMIVVAFLIWLAPALSAQEQVQKKTPQLIPTRLIGAQGLPQPVEEIIQVKSFIREQNNSDGEVDKFSTVEISNLIPDTYREGEIVIFCLDEKGDVIMRQYYTNGMTTSFGFATVGVRKPEDLGKPYRAGSFAMTNVDVARLVIFLRKVTTPQGTWEAPPPKTIEDTRRLIKEGAQALPPAEFKPAP